MSSSSVSLINEDVSSEISWHSDEQGWIDLASLSSQSSAFSIVEDEEKSQCFVETKTAITMTESIVIEDNGENDKETKVKKLLEKKIKEFQNYKKDMETHLEEERKKFKLAFEEANEKRNSDFKSAPNRQEQEKILALKIEVAALQETLKLKETKHGTAQAQLRNRIKILVGENANLKVKVDTLNKTHAKHVVSHFSKPQMVDEVNKYTTKVSTKQTKKTSRKDEATKDKEKGCDCIESLLSNGTKQIECGSGKVKCISPDSNVIVFEYLKGDVKEINFLRGTVRHQYFKDKSIHTINVKSSDVTQFRKDPVEKPNKNGECKMLFSNGSRNKLKSTGTIISTTHDKHANDNKQIRRPNGTIKMWNPQGVRKVTNSNGRMCLIDKLG
ncbi:hypothetical protein FQA39_LY10014 [Lamprigera yunnana]|nr:hypothetical protein FQA39_LY10014 [Lamprigera yunnana]